MTQPTNPLSIAFIWHMHQPDYKDDFTGEYLMPWVRLHAIKDYLDMVLLLEPYPKIRQTFNLVPSLIDQLEDYCRPETQDRHLAVTLREAFSAEDRQFILQRFFDAPYGTMIAKSQHYRELHGRRRPQGETDFELGQFSEQDLADITALFHLVWTDPLWFKKYPELQTLWNKGAGYTLADRHRIIEIQREIINSILPTYRKFQESGQIEVTTTPYYHPILPLLIDTDSARVAMPNAILPEERFRHPEDARFHVEGAQKRYREIFGRSAQGVWPAEQSVSPAAIDLLKEVGEFTWAVSSEGILAHSLGIPIEKDLYGNIMNADVFCSPYRYAGMNLLFRNLTLSDLIGFHYATLSAEQAVDDFMYRIKHLQHRCELAGVDHPIITVALDGENCWESFPEDGHWFLNLLYKRLSEDESLNICRVCDYFDTLPASQIKPLERLHAGSWINSNFHIWIADPVKNAAWTYLYKTRNDLAHFTEAGRYASPLIASAWEEIYVAEGSDWFWWYGEPNHSGQDDVFDMQFRRHLANVYRILDLEVPGYLSVPLTITMGRTDTSPAAPISPQITGRRENADSWKAAGSLDLTHGAMNRATRILNKVLFGSDQTSAYFRFDLNAEALSPYHEIYVYCCTPGKTRHNSPIRIKSAGGHTVLTQRYHYAYEIQLSRLLPGQVMVSCAEALPDHLWMHHTDLVSAIAYEDILDISVNLEAMQIGPGELLQFTVALVQGEVLEEIHPTSSVIPLERLNYLVSEPVA